MDKSSPEPPWQGCSTMENRAMLTHHYTLPNRYRLWEWLGFVCLLATLLSNYCSYWQALLEAIHTTDTHTYTFAQLCRYTSINAHTHVKKIKPHPPANWAYWSCPLFLNHNMHLDTFCGRSDPHLVNQPLKGIVQHFGKYTLSRWELHTVLKIQ